MKPFHPLPTLFRKPLLLLAAVFLLQWSLLFTIAGPTWDAVFYYAYGRSVVFDQDLRLENDLIHSYPTATADFVARQYDTILTGTGRVATPFAVGASLIWLPWLVILRLLAGLTQSGPLSGYEWFFIANIATLSAVGGLLAFWLAYRLARPYTGHLSALLAVLTLMFATPLLYYQFREPMYSHAASALTTTLAVYVWQRRQTDAAPMAQALGLGALIGLAGLVRWQNLMYLALPFVTAVFWWLEATDLPQRKRVVIYLAGLTAAAVAVFSLQMAVWQTFYGSYFTIPQGDAFMDWRGLYVGPFLFSTFRGLLPWMPVTLFAVVGLILIGRQQWRLVLPLLAVLLLAVYINGSTPDWFAGGGFGPRRFTSELPILALGYAGFLQRLSRRWRLAAGGILGLGLAFHQWLLLRYALAERIGGRVLSMYPTFGWSDEPMPTFVQALLARASEVLRPLDFLVFAGSPLDMLLRHRLWPWQHGLALLATAFFTFLLLAAAARIYRRRTPSAVFPHRLTLSAALLLLLINLWILTSA